MGLTIIFIIAGLVISFGLCFELIEPSVLELILATMGGFAISAAICLGIMLGFCVYDPATNQDTTTNLTDVVMLSPIFKDIYVIPDSEHLSYKPQGKQFTESILISVCQFKRCGNGSYEVPTIEIYSTEFTNPFVQFMIGPCADPVYKIYLPADGGGL